MARYLEIAERKFIEKLLNGKYFKTDNKTVKI